MFYHFACLYQLSTICAKRSFNFIHKKIQRSYICLTVLCYLLNHITEIQKQIELYYLKKKKKSQLLGLSAEFKLSVFQSRHNL